MWIRNIHVYKIYTSQTYIFCLTHLDTTISSPLSFKHIHIYMHMYTQTRTNIYTYTSTNIYIFNTHIPEKSKSNLYILCNTPLDTIISSPLSYEYIHRYMHMYTHTCTNIYIYSSTNIHIFNTRIYKKNQNCTFCVTYLDTTISSPLFQVLERIFAKS